MGKTSKPLTILVSAELFDLPEIQALEAKGHTVSALAMGHVDMFLAPEAWRMTPDLLKYLPLAVKAARQQKYPNKKGGTDAD